ncbi:ABC transporter substrate-binding protein [Carboxydochorda subterranea]|uniref:ABC transporter substrate-binding protein n=1 Tax=Carboxydichorda subterranea TaxID=3109565 RepID=A0ABZ1BX11_9FIRM|nr:ABC transporter substrate-binding protein [Limnochorda sp. L945t]WRP17334.1 ABC transporter substrate-binding protein [Limnochorda sp. L945t]
MGKGTVRIVGRFLAAALVVVLAGAGALAAPVKITFWHSMGGDLGGRSIPEMVDRFNKSQTMCVVEASYQGTYDDALNKLKAGLQSKDIPAVIQLYDIATRLMIDLGVAVPVQEFVDKEGYDLSDFERNVLAYYSVGGKLYSMPFNTSNPLLYYNVDAFRKAGLDPGRPPRTFDEVLQVGRKLTVKDSAGHAAQYGISLAIYGWFFEQFLAVSGGYYVNNGNGRDSRATEATFNGPQGVRVLDWWKRLFDEGVNLNLGRRTVDARNAFTAGRAAMVIDSTATLRSLLDASTGRFELGTGFLPRPSEQAFSNWGTIIGGASLWILKDRPEAERKCAWEFVKHMASPKEQAFWYTVSGYYPIRLSGYNEPLAIEWREKYPQFETAIQQLHLAPNNRVTQGALIGVFPQARQTIEGAIETVLAGRATPKVALDQAAQSVTDAIWQYNLTTGR